MTIETQTPRPQRRWGKLLFAAALIFGLGGATGFGIAAHKASACLLARHGAGKT